MEELDYATLRSFVRDLEGTALRTRAQKKEFTVNLAEDGLIYTPSATGKPRHHKQKFVERFISKFNETKSMQPGNYTDISANASYLLTIIDEMIKQEAHTIWTDKKEQLSAKYPKPNWLEPLISQIKALRADHEHKERAHESLVEYFFELLGYTKFEDIKHRQGRIDISLVLNERILIVVEVKRNWNLPKDPIAALRQAYNYAAENGVRFVLVTNGDYYALYDRQHGLSYDSNYIGEFTLTALTEENMIIIEMLKRDQMLKIEELSLLGAVITFPKF